MPVRYKYAARGFAHVAEMPRLKHDARFRLPRLGVSYDEAVAPRVGVEPHALLRFDKLAESAFASTALMSKASPV